MSAVRSIHIASRYILDMRCPRQIVVIGFVCALVGVVAGVRGGAYIFQVLPGRDVVVVVIVVVVLIVGDSRVLRWRRHFDDLI